MSDVSNWMDKAIEDAGVGKSHTWRLYGNNAIVGKGESVVVRLLPNKKAVANFEFKDGKLIELSDKISISPYLAFREHWLGHGQNSFWTLCPKSVFSNHSCPICSLTISDVKSKKLLLDLQPRETFIWTAVIGQPKHRHTDDTGEIDVRGILISRQIYRTLIQEAVLGVFGKRGDFTHPIKGFDIGLTRPSVKGERWRVTFAPEPKPIVELKSGGPDIKAIESVLNRIPDLHELAASIVKPIDVISDKIQTFLATQAIEIDVDDVDEQDTNGNTQHHKSDDDIPF